MAEAATESATSSAAIFCSPVRLVLGLPRKNFVRFFAFQFGPSLSSFWASVPLRRSCQLTMPVSAVYLLDSKGKVIISRDYRGDIPIKCLERFITHVLETDETELKPIFEEDGINYIYIKYNSLYGAFESED